MADKTFHEMIKETQKRFGLRITSGYRTKDDQDRLVQNSCHCHSYHLGPNMLPPNEHSPNCPMYRGDNT